MALNPSVVTLTWTAATDAESSVDHYVIYRNGLAIATSPANSYADASVQASTTYSYQVSSVNRDGYESGQSATVTIGVAGVVSKDWPDNRHIEIYFSEPLSAATAGVLSHYVLSGGTFSGVALSRSNTLVTLTTTSAAHASPMLAPAAVYSSSGSSARSPAARVWPTRCAAQLRRRAMAEEFSWETSARVYEDVYQHALHARRTAG